MAFNEQKYRQLISGQTSGAVAALARGGLSLLSLGYRCGTGVRNALFDLGLRSIRRASVPIVSVGNLTTGGTGKTPVVAWFVQQLLAMNMRPGIISRGYRAVDDSGNDEKRVLAKLCPGVAHEQNSSRWLAAQSLLASSEPPDVIVMDDGFQHRQLHRDLNVLLIDATNPFGFGHLLPRGLLREPLASMRRADCVLITRADMVTQQSLDTIRNVIKTTAPALADRTIEMTFQPTDLVDTQGARVSLEDLKGSPVFLASGIGNPAAFEGTCRAAGLTVSDRLWFPDHHHFSDVDVRTMIERAGTATVVVTLKDLVKLPQSFPAVALNIAAEFPRSGDVEFLLQLLRERLLTHRP